MNGNPTSPIALVPIGTDTLEVNLLNYRKPTSNPDLRAAVSPALLQRLQRMAGHEERFQRHLIDKPKMSLQ